MLPIILVMLLFSQGQAEDYGTDFVTAFPENIAYYYPADIALTLKITALLETTNIQIFVNGTQWNQPLVLGRGQTTFVGITDMEETQIGLSTKTVRVTSDKNITVLSLIKRGDSVQTNVVLPVTTLNNSYLIPRPNYTELAVLLNSYNYPTSSTSYPQLAFNFRLIVINAENQTNEVKVTNKSAEGQAEEKTYNLPAFTMIQLQSSIPWMKVTSSLKVAVIYTHPCVDTINCRCNMIMHQVRPTSLQDKEFIVPPFVNTTLTRLFVTAPSNVDVTAASQTTSVSSGSTGLLPFGPTATASTMKLSVAGSLRLIRPGLMLDLLPNSMFAGCFLVHSSSWLQTLVLIIANTTEKDQTKKDDAALSPTWNDLSDSSHSWALHNIDPYKSHVIWHPTSKIAVYVFDKTAAGVMHGSPAIVLNDEPDYNGCSVTDEKFEISNDTMGWVQSRHHCGSKSMILISPSVAITHDKMKAELLKSGLQSEVWLGLRRSLVNSSWYWQSHADFDFNQWAEGHPQKVMNGMCASMTQNFTWTSTRCCSQLKPLCYLPSIFINSITVTGTTLQSLTTVWPSPSTAPSAPTTSID